MPSCISNFKSKPYRQHTHTYMRERERAPWKQSEPGSIFEVKQLWKRFRQVHLERSIAFRSTLNWERHLGCQLSKQWERFDMPCPSGMPLGGHVKVSVFPPDSTWGLHKWMTLDLFWLDWDSFFSSSSCQAVHKFKTKGKEAGIWETLARNWSHWFNTKNGVLNAKMQKNQQAWHSCHLMPSNHKML